MVLILEGDSGDSWRLFVTSSARCQILLKEGMSVRVQFEMPFRGFGLP